MDLYNIPQFPSVEALRRRAGLSERELTRVSGVSRMTLRGISAASSRARLSSLARVAQGLGRDLEVVFGTPETNSAHSVVGAAYQILRDGFDSWRLHLFNFVDEYRRSLDSRLLTLPPPHEVDQRIAALLASTVLALCQEADGAAPRWAERSHALRHPWFVAEMSSLRAIALVESPVAFRRNNIFVLRNFLERA